MATNEKPGASTEEPAAPSKEPRQNLLVPEQERWPLDESQPVIELDDVYKSFGDNHVINGLSLKVIPGKTTVIVGRSGSGKSVLLKLMMGLLKPDRGRVVLFGKDVAEISDVELIELRKRMSMLFQNYALFDSLPVEENVGFTLLENSQLERPKIMGLAHELLRILGLEGSELKLPSELSGGMKKRVSLARALISNPEVVLFDEPTTGLDPIMIEKVDEMIVLAKNQYQITSAIISHDMASTKRLADRVAFLHGGRIIFYGTYDEFMATDVGPVKSFVEGASTNRLDRVSAARDDADTAVRDEIDTTELDNADTAVRDDVDTAVRDDASAAAPHRVAAGVAAPPTAEPDPTALVELIDVHKHFGTNYVLRGVNLKIYPGKISVLIGGSGSGKSVIIKHIMGLFRPDSGVVRVFDTDVAKATVDEVQAVRQRVGMLFQHAALLDWLTVSGNVAFSLRERTETPEPEIQDRVSDLLKQLHISDIADAMPGAISEGQKKRVGLARAIIVKPEIMIYDEPTTGQDPIRTRQVDDMIQEAQEEFDITSIVISHDMASTFRVAHTIALLNKGEIFAYGSPDEVRASPNDYVQHFIYAGQVET